MCVGGGGGGGGGVGMVGGFLGGPHTPGVYNTLGVGG